MGVRWPGGNRRNRNHNRNRNRNRNGNGKGQGMWRRLREESAFAWGQGPPLRDDILSLRRVVAHPCATRTLPPGEGGLRARPGVCLRLGLAPGSGRTPPEAIAFDSGRRWPFAQPDTPCRARAQATCSRTSGEGSSRRDSSAASTSGVEGALPSATARLRSQRSWPLRRIGLPSVRRRNSSSSHANSCGSVAVSRSLRARKSGSSVRLANLFQGQTSWQSSQPKMRLPIAGRSSCGIGPSCSMVR